MRLAEVCVRGEQHKQDQHELYNRCEHMTKLKKPSLLFPVSQEITDPVFLDIEYATRLNKNDVVCRLPTTSRGAASLQHLGGLCGLILIGLVIYSRNSWHECLPPASFFPPCPPQQAAVITVITFVLLRSPSPFLFGKDVENGPGTRC